MKIAERLEELCDKAEEIFLAGAGIFPDALSVSSIAALKKSPILYCSPTGEPDKMTACWLTGEPYVEEPAPEEPEP